MTFSNPCFACKVIGISFFILGSCARWFMFVSFVFSDALIVVEYNFYCKKGKNI